MGTATKRRLKPSHLREGATPFDRLPWDIQRFAIDFLRCHQCEVTPSNCQVVAEAVEARLNRRAVCHAELSLLIEDDVFFE